MAAHDPRKWVKYWRILMAKKNGKIEETKVLIAMPCFSGEVPTETMVSVISLVRYHSIKYPEHVVCFMPKNRHFITYAMEKLTETAVDGFTHILIWGDDMVAPHDTLEKLLAHDKAVVGCMVFTRTPPFAMLAYDNDLNMLNISHANTGLIKVRAAGNGVMLIKTDVFKRLARPWWKWPTHIKYGSDIDWGLRVKEELGIDTWVDTNLEAGHLDQVPTIVGSSTHRMWLESVRASGILDDPKVKSHEDYNLLKPLFEEDDG